MSRVDFFFFFGGGGVFRMSVSKAILLPSQLFPFPSSVNPFSSSLFFGQVQKFYFRKFIASFVFMLERDIKRPFFSEKTLNFFFHTWVKKLKNQIKNEIFRQKSLTLTLPLAMPASPMDAKGLNELENDAAKMKTGGQRIQAQYGNYPKSLLLYTRCTARLAALVSPVHTVHCTAHRGGVKNQPSYSLIHYLRPRSSAIMILINQKM